MYVCACARANPEVTRTEQRKKERDMTSGVVSLAEKYRPSTTSTFIKPPGGVFFTKYHSCCVVQDVGTGTSARESQTGGGVFCLFLSSHAEKKQRGGSDDHKLNGLVTAHACIHARAPLLLS